MEAGVGGRRGAELLEVIRRGTERPADTVPLDPSAAAPKPDDPPLVALAESLVRARAREAGLAYELLATRAELQAIVTATRAGGEADVRTLRGWRREVAGQELLELLGGRSSLRVSGAGSDARVQIAAHGRRRRARVADRAGSRGAARGRGQRRLRLSLTPDGSPAREAPYAKTALRSRFAYVPRLAPPSRVLAGRFVRGPAVAPRHAG